MTGTGDVYDIGDPYVFRYDGKYYLYTSLNGDSRHSARSLAGSPKTLSTGNGRAGRTIRIRPL